MVLHVVATGGCHGVKLMVGQLRERTPCDTKRVVELIVGVVHLIDTEHRFQAALVEGTSGSPSISGSICAHTFGKTGASSVS